MGWALRSGTPWHCEELSGAQECPSGVGTRGSWGPSLQTSVLRPEQAAGAPTVLETGSQGRVLWAADPPRAQTCSCRRRRGWGEQGTATRGGQAQHSTGFLLPREELGMEPGSQFCGHRVLKIQKPFFFFFLFLGLPKERGTERHSVAREEAVPLGSVGAGGVGSRPSSRPSV